MLYVFQVDIGTLMTFEMKLAMETVASLKRAITSKTNIPQNKQVLLVSGGQSLEDNHRVCSYSSAGTDTSPIFLFAKVTPESSQVSQFVGEYDNTDISDMIESCRKMGPSLDTLVARAELALNISKLSAMHEEVVQKMVNDQHLQQQAWAAVVANLGDLLNAYRKKHDFLVNTFKLFFERRQLRLELLSRFKKDLQTLDNIPILPVLTDSSSRYLNPSTRSRDNTSSSDSSNTKSVGGKLVVNSTTSGQSDGSGVINQAGDEKESDVNNSVAAVQSQESSSTTPSISSATTLLQWIDFHDSHNNLEKLAEFCTASLDRFNEECASKLDREVQEIIKSANNQNMISIKGLEDRLMGLETILSGAKETHKDQDTLAQSFFATRRAICDTRDFSMLPEITKNNEHQLGVMLNNHIKIRDFRNKAIRAKEEFSINLQNRLKWVLYVEQQLKDSDAKLMIYKENLSKLDRFFEIIEQVHKAPELYLASVCEAMRRRRFSRSYLHWASVIAKTSLELYEKEVATRKEFEKMMGSHFLRGLFPGLTSSYPPPFATTQPDPFDTKLPRITMADISYLQSNIAEELVDKLVLPNDVPMPHIVSSVSQRACRTDLNQEQEDLDDRQSLNPTPPSTPQLG